MNETSTIKREYDNHTITRVMIYNTMLSRKIGKKKNMAYISLSRNHGRFINDTISTTSEEMLFGEG